MTACPRWSTHDFNQTRGVYWETMTSLYHVEHMQAFKLVPLDPLVKILSVPLSTLCLKPVLRSPSSSSNEVFHAALKRINRPSSSSRRPSSPVPAPVAVRDHLSTLSSLDTSTELSGGVITQLFNPVNQSTASSPSTSVMPMLSPNTEDIAYIIVHSIVLPFAYPSVLMSSLALISRRSNETLPVSFAQPYTPSWTSMFESSLCTIALPFVRTYGVSSPASQRGPRRLPTVSIAPTSTSHLQCQYQMCQRPVSSTVCHQPRAAVHSRLFEMLPAQQSQSSDDQEQWRHKSAFHSQFFKLVANACAARPLVSLLSVRLAHRAVQALRVVLQSQLTSPSGIVSVCALEPFTAFRTYLLEDISLSVIKSSFGALFSAAHPVCRKHKPSGVLTCIRYIESSSPLVNRITRGHHTSLCPSPLPSERCRLSSSDPPRSPSCRSLQRKLLSVPTQSGPVIESSIWYTHSPSSQFQVAVSFTAAVPVDLRAPPQHTSSCPSRPSSLSATSSRPPEHIIQRLKQLVLSTHRELVAPMDRHALGVALINQSTLTISRNIKSEYCLLGATLSQQQHPISTVTQRHAACHLSDTTMLRQRAHKNKTHRVRHTVLSRSRRRPESFNKHRLHLASELTIALGVIKCVFLQAVTPSSGVLGHLTGQGQSCSPVQSYLNLPISPRLADEVSEKRASF
eukprot:gene24598-30964_t